MYHKLVETILSEGTMQGLLDELEGRGFRIYHQPSGTYTEKDIHDAWEEFKTSGPEAAVDYLETMLGFVFE